MKTLSPDSFLQSDAPLIFDVRSPGEFLKGHIPGALNFPLFSDAERAQVGLCYKQQGAEPAMLLGLELVGPKLADFVRRACQLNPRKTPIRMYCFRGGERSHSMAWLLEKGGFSIQLLGGGYKAYRRHLLESFGQPQAMLVLSGCTGAGKTRVLQSLRRRGEQVLDLEELACHKGSAFGGYRQPSDLTTEMFQNLLHQDWRTLQRDRRVWVEDEGRTLGKLVIPDEFWNQMRAAPVVFLDVDQESRVNLLVEEYGQCDPALLLGSVNRIQKRLGGVVHRRCVEALGAGDHAEVVRLCLDYYDRAYLHCVEKRDPHPLWKLRLDGIDTEKNTTTLLESVEQFQAEEIGQAKRNLAK